MPLTMKRPSKEERRERRIELMRRIRKNARGFDPEESLSPEEMIALLKRHERAILEAAKRAGLDVENDYDDEY